MELSVGTERVNGGGDRQYALINKLFNLLDGNKWNGGNLNRVKGDGDMPASGVVKVSYALRLEGNEGVSVAGIWRNCIPGRMNMKHKHPKAVVCMLCKEIARRPVKLDWINKREQNKR